MRYVRFLLLVGWNLWYCGHYWPFVPAPGDRWWWRNWWNEDWQGKPKYSEKTCLSATLSTTNPTWLDPGLNPGCRGGKPATNRLSYGAAKYVRYITFCVKIHCGCSIFATKICKIMSVSFAVCLWPSIRFQQQQNRWTNIYEIWYLTVLLKCVETF
jgi:hypothetical protein